MPVQPTYPGIYLEELPSNDRTITAAPTSITVFVGYTHPFKTKKFDEAVRIFDFTEYQREFGGFYTSKLLDASVPYAVNQFFLNGGSDAYVVGLKPHYVDSAQANKGDINQPEFITGNIKFKGLELIDSIPMTVKIDNRRKTINDNDTADILIIYGSQVETFRNITLNTNSENQQNYLPNRINNISTLVTVSVNPEPLPPAIANYGAAFTVVTDGNLVYSPLLDASWKAFFDKDFTDVFKEDSSLDKVSIFNLLVIPGVSADNNQIWSAALAFCERKEAFAILDPPIDAAADLSSAPLLLIADKFENVPKSKNGAIYFPYLKSNDAITGNLKELPPSGYVAGIYAKTDLNRGVWKAPAGLETTLLNTTGVVDRGKMTDKRQGTLNPIGVNCLRSFPGIGTVVYGARTLVAGNIAFQQSKYVPVRRMTLFIKQTLYRNLGWVVFEPNDEPLWVAIRTSIESFMLSLFNQGAFQGSTPSQAFQVKCDKSTTTQQDINNGVVNIIVAFAPLKPAEFVIVKIAQLAGQVQS